MSTIPVGYKLTEVGMIPADWDTKPLGELASVTAGGTPSRANPLFWNGDIPWVTTAEVDSLYIDHAAQSITTEGLKCSAAKTLPPGTLLMALYGQGKTRGKVGILGINAATNQACAAISLHRGVSGKFVLHFLRSQYEAIRNLSNTGNQENLNNSLVRSIPVLLPPVAEQNVIAEALSDADALIESLEQLLTKKRHLKQAAMQELLTGKKRLPGFSGEWEVNLIGEFTDCSAGGTPSTTMPEYWGGSVRWMNSGELNLKTVSEVAGRITDQGMRNSSTKLIPSGCVLIGLAGQGKTRGTVAMNTVALCTNQSIAAIFPNESFEAKYLYYNLDNRYEELRELSAGDGGRGGLNLTLIRSLALPFPSVEEQAAIAAVLSDMDTEITELEAQLTKTRAIKQGMMQKLLTGEIRLI